MGNCMSTLGGQRKQRVASPSQQEAISLAIKASMNKEKAPAPTKPYPNESYGPAFPNGDILLTTADDLTRETSVPSTFVDSPGPQKNEAPANDDALAIAPVPNDHASAYCAHGATSGHKNAPTGDGGIKLDNDDFLEDAEIGIAKAVSITHMGKARIVETKSAANLHSARSASGPANLFRPSATMVDMNKARQMYPGNDPVAAYVERDNLRVKNASEKWEPRARELQANHRRRVAADSARRQMELAEATKSEIQEIAQSSGSAPRMYGPPVVGRGDVNTGFVGERGPMVPMRPAQPSPVYLQQGRSFSQPKPMPRMQSANQLSVAPNPVSPVTPGFAMGPVSPLTPTPSDTFNEATNYGSIGDFSGASGRSNTPGSNPPRTSSLAHLNRRYGYATFDDIPSPILPPRGSDVPMRRDTPQQEQLSMAPEPRPSRPNMGYLSQGQPKREQRSNDDEMWQKALKRVDQKLEQVRPIILQKVRMFVDNAEEANSIAEKILSMDDKVIGVSAQDNTRAFKMVRTKIEEIRNAASELQRSGLPGPSNEDMKYTFDVSKQRKALAMMSKWKAEAKERAERENQERAQRDLQGKGKQKEGAKPPFRSLDEDIF